MLCNRRCICVRLVAMCVLAITPVVATGEDEPDFAVTKDVELLEVSPGRRRISVRLDSLPLGSNGVVVLNVTNRTKRNLKIDEVRAGCACSEFEISGKQFAAGKSTVVSVQLRTPRAMRSQHNVIRAAFVEADSKSLPIEMTMMYTVKGQLSFSDSLFTFTMPPNLKTAKSPHRIRVPCFVSEPVRDDELTFTVLGDFQDRASARLVRVENERFVELDVDRGDETGDLSGAIRIQHPPTGAEDLAKCYLRVDRPLRISPSIIRLTGAENEKYSGTAILRILKKRNADSDGENAKTGEALSKPRVSIFANNKPVPADIKLLGNGPVFRVRVNLSASSLPKDRKNASYQWVVFDADNVRHVLDTQFRLSKPILGRINGDD